ncbi:hypothetical protein HA402_005316 [Bradysia odoriphaga]|nr:hypothetical protein HA402_005316 [Bradysia odoriphaga]
MRTLTMKMQVKNKHLWRFTDVMHSFMVVFRAQCGEWIETMFMCLQVTSNRTVCFIYYFILVTVGSFQIMHIFTALLFTNDDSTAISTNKSRKWFQKTAEPKERFQLQPFLKEKLLEPSVKKIYDEYKPKKDIESVGEFPTVLIVTKAPIEDDTSESIDNTDTSIPIEQSPANNQSCGLKSDKRKYFQHCVTLCIIASSCSLAVEYDIYANSRPTLMMVSLYIDFLFIGLLSIEVVTKLVARGWKLCITDIWYWVDLFNIIIAVLEMLSQSDTIAVLESLRPLSLVSRFHGLNLITNAILKQMWFLVNTLLVCLAFWLIFAIMGVQLFGGKFYSCVDENGIRVESVVNRTECNEPYLWENAFMNFNDVFDSYYSLLQVSSFKGWIQIISNAVDSSHVHSQPIDEVNIYMFFYFVIFVVCGVFVCTNVIVGMLVQHMMRFGSLTELLEGSKSKSDESNDKDESTDQNPSYSKFVSFVRSRAFELIAFGSYTVFIISLMCDHYRNSEETSNALAYIHLVLSIVLIIEIVVRAFAYRKEFFNNSWNRFDVVLLIFTIIDFIAADLTAKYFVSTSLLRAVRFGRFNGLIASLSKSLARCGKVINRTWSTVSMLYVLLLLVIWVYSLIGMVLYQDEKIEFGSVDILNFKTFGQSAILMIQMSTAAGWDGLLAQLYEKHEVSATLYLLSFLYIVSTILLNVMLVIGFEFYKELTSVEDERQQLKPHDLNDFDEKWKGFAQDNLKYVTKNRLGDFFRSLDQSSALRPAEFDEKEFALLGIETKKEDNYSRSALLVALNRMRLSKH